MPLMQLSARTRHVTFHRVFAWTIVAFDTLLFLGTLAHRLLLYCTVVSAIVFNEVLYLHAGVHLSTGLAYPGAFVCFFPGKVASDFFTRLLLKVLPLVYSNDIFGNDIFGNLCWPVIGFPS